jgi:hypothetical protein
MGDGPPRRHHSIHYFASDMVGDHMVFLNSRCLRDRRVDQIAATPPRPSQSIQSSSTQLMGLGQAEEDVSGDSHAISPGFPSPSICRETTVS